jgi:hypothetical protein
MSFHVFLSHSSADKPAVEELARRLAKPETEPLKIVRILQGARNASAQL